MSSVCLDSLTGGSEGSEGREVTIAEVYVDAALAAPTRGEAGVTLSSGLRAGPNTLSEILCTGKVRVVFTGDQASRSEPLTFPRRSLPLSAATSGGATKGSVSSTGAAAVIGSNPTTSATDHRAATMTHQTWR